MVEQGDEIELAEALDRFSRKADKLLKTENTNTAKIEIQAGGIGVGVALAACALMLGVNLGLAIMIVSHDRKIDELTNYLNAIYMMAPHLKPEKKAE